MAGMGLQGIHVTLREHESLLRFCSSTMRLQTSQYGYFEANNTSKMEHFRASWHDLTQIIWAGVISMPCGCIVRNLHLEFR